jgi:membrane protein
MFDKLLSTPTAQVGRVGRFLIFQAKLWIHCFRLLSKNRSGDQAAAMSYYTVFGLVPLAVVMLTVCQFFPSYRNTGQEIKEGIYSQLHLTTIEYPDPGNPEVKIKLTDNLDALVTRILTGFTSGTIAIIGAFLIIVAAIMMLITIESTFNHIWGVSRGRSIITRISNYWLLITGGPLLAMAAAAFATKYATINELQKTLLSHTAPIIVSYILAVAGFFVLYLWLPNAKVKVRAAIWGAIVAALAWTIVKWGFKMYVTKFIPYNEIYGVIGLIPLGVFWIYLSWYIVLFGLQLTYTTQHLRSLDEAEIAAAKKSEEYFIASELTIMNIVGEIAGAFEGGGGVMEPSAISSKLDMPAEFVEKILNHLVNAGLLVRVSEPKDGFMPARDPGSMKLADIAEAVSKAGFAQAPEEQPAGLQLVAKLQREALSQYTVKQIIEGSQKQ